MDHIQNTINYNRAYQPLTQNHTAFCTILLITRDAHFTTVHCGIPSKRDRKNNAKKLMI